MANHNNPRVYERVAKAHTHAVDLRTFLHACTSLAGLGQRG